MPRVEWIGYRSPTANDRISRNVLFKQYNPFEEATLHAAARVLRPYIRVDGKRSRRLRPKDGFSKHYRWGPERGSYIQVMTDLDAERLFNLSSGVEFRNLDDPAHDNRVPMIPERLVDETLYRILVAAHNGPPVYLSSPLFFRDGQKLKEAYETLTEQAAHQYR